MHMAYEITAACTKCWACEPLCPSQAIYEDADRLHLRIHVQKCTNCEGDYADAQCASICPIEGAILNPYGEMANPPGSLTGIPPEKWNAAMAEIQAR